jgi:hypothetical protein
VSVIAALRAQRRRNAGLLLHRAGRRRDPGGGVSLARPADAREGSRGGAPGLARPDSDPALAGRVKEALQLRVARLTEPAAGGTTTPKSSRLARWMNRQQRRAGTQSHRRPARPRRDSGRTQPRRCRRPRLHPRADPGPRASAGPESLEAVAGWLAAQLPRGVLADVLADWLEAQLAI